MVKFVPRAALAGTVAVLALAGCNVNVFSPFDQPGNDAQYLSAGDACFDAGDFSCAQKNYAKLSSNSADEQASREASLELAQGGAPMEAFIEGFGSKSNSPGYIVTVMANYMISHGTQGPSSRAAMVASYSAASAITDNSRLSGLGQFQAAFGLLAEIMAEGAGTEPSLLASNLVANPSACISAGATSCQGSASCAPPSPKVDTFSESTCNDLPSSSFSASTFAAYWTGGNDGANATPDFCMVDAALQAVFNAATTLGIGGSSTANFANVFVAEQSVLLNGLVVPPQYACYRSLLLSEGIGS